MLNNNSMNAVTGSFNLSKTQKVKITLDKKPRFVLCVVNRAGGLLCVYNEQESTTQIKRWFGSTGEMALATSNLLVSQSNGAIYSIDDDGFTVNIFTEVKTVYYWAIM